jgi:hypothetical protein
MGRKQTGTVRQLYKVYGMEPPDAAGNLRFDDAGKEEVAALRWRRRMEECTAIPTSLRNVDRFTDVHQDDGGDDEPAERLSCYREREAEEWLDLVVDTASAFIVHRLAHDRRLCKAFERWTDHGEATPPVEALLRHAFDCSTASTDEQNQAAYSHGHQSREALHDGTRHLGSKRPANDTRHYRRVSETWHALIRSRKLTGR